LELGNAVIWLVLGLLIWVVAHSFKRFAPDARARMGDAGKGVVAVLVLVSVVMMVIGYRGADVTPIWVLDGWALSLNNLLMVFAVIMMGVGNSQSRLRGKLRHPMLTGLLVWSVAHLLVNGDLPSLVLFGGLGLWAIATIVVINRAEPAPEPFTDGTTQGDVKLLVISAVVFAVIVGIHTWLGYWPFPG
jgi:uncharacterized membrane protein